MMHFNTLKEVAQFRISENEDNYWIEDYWKAAVETAVRNIDETLTFIQKDCDNEELYVLSEIFEELAKRTKNRKIIQALRERLEKVTPENYNQQDFTSEYMRKCVDYNEYVNVIEEEIGYADGQIED